MTFLRRVRPAGERGSTFQMSEVLGSDEHPWQRLYSPDWECTFRTWPAIVQGRMQWRWCVTSFRRKGPQFDLTLCAGVAASREDAVLAAIAAANAGDLQAAEVGLKRRRLAKVEW